MQGTGVVLVHIPAVNGLEVTYLVVGIIDGTEAAGVAGVVHRVEGVENTGGGIGLFQAVELVVFVAVNRTGSKDAGRIKHPVAGQQVGGRSAVDVAGGVVGVGGVVAPFDAQGGKKDVVHGRHPVVGVVGEFVAHFATVAVRAVFYSTDIPYQRRTAVRQRKI